MEVVPFCGIFLVFFLCAHSVQVGCQGLGLHVRAAVFADEDAVGVPRRLRACSPSVGIRVGRRGGRRG